MRPTEYPFRTRISKSQPKTYAPLLAGGIIKPPVPTNGSITNDPYFTLPWLHIINAKSLSADVGPRYILLLNSKGVLNFAFPILLEHSSRPKYTCFNVD